MTDNQIIEAIASAMRQADDELPQAQAVGVWPPEPTEDPRRRYARAALSAIRKAYTIVPKDIAWDEADKDVLLYGIGFIMRTSEGDERIDPTHVQVKMKNSNLSRRKRQRENEQPAHLSPKMP